MVINNLVFNHLKKKLLNNNISLYFKSSIIYKHKILEIIHRKLLHI